jgi:hypothetical protein
MRLGHALIPVPRSVVVMVVWPVDNLIAVKRPVTAVPGRDGQGVAEENVVIAVLLSVWETRVQSPPAAQEARLRGHSLENSRLFFQPMTPGSPGNWQSCGEVSIRAGVFRHCVANFQMQHDSIRGECIAVTMASGSLPLASGEGKRFSWLGSHAPSTARRRTCNPFERTGPFRPCFAPGNGTHDPLFTS